VIQKLVINGMSDEFKDAYLSKLSAFLEMAPEDAKTRSLIQKLRKGYVGVLDISSKEGHFLAKATCKDPNDLIFSLLVQIFRQITTTKPKTVYM
jgi:hypothetical protein